MYLLDEQVALIRADVDSARITITHLSQELVDHICCEVEAKMNEGISFDLAYAQVKTEAGITVLQKIQEHTLYLTDQRYAWMKTTMKISGNVSLAFLGIGSLLRIYHVPGASILLLLGCTLLCFVFFPLLVYIKPQDQEASRPALFRFSMLMGGIAFMMGILFKAFHWPGANVLLLTGWVLLLCIFLPVLLWMKWRTAASAKERSVYVLGAVALWIFEAATLMKVFHWPGVLPMMVTGSILLVSIFLPLFGRMHAAEKGMTARFVFLITMSMYAIVMTMLLSMHRTVPEPGQTIRETPPIPRIVHPYEGFYAYSNQP